MLSWGSHNGQCKILACGEKGSSLKCNLNKAEAVHRHEELILNLYVWQVRDFQNFCHVTSKTSGFHLFEIKPNIEIQGFSLGWIS